MQIRSYMQDARQYCRDANIMHREGWGKLRMGELIALFPQWQRCQRPEANSLDDAQPWVVFPAIRFLDGLLNKNMRVFEFGAGGSTLYFARHTQEVFAVEHDPAWADRVQSRVKNQRLANAHIMLQLPEPDPQAHQRSPADPDGYTSSDADHRNCSFRQYAACIDSFRDGFFDVIVIDGRARPSCCRHAKPKVPIGGWLILDNSERAEYRFIHEALAGPCWLKHTFNGPGPYARWCFWQTCAWQRLG